MNQTHINTANGCNYCTFPRRMACIIYDAVIVAALWMLAALPVVLLHDGPIPAATWWFQTYLLLVAGVYYVWSWWRGGQTIGMRTWRVHLMSIQQHPVTLPSCIWRYVAALLSTAAFAIGWLWALGHPAKLAWHDLLSGTQLWTSPKRKQA